MASTAVSGRRSNTARCTGLSRKDVTQLDVDIGFMYKRVSVSGGKDVKGENCARVLSLRRI